MAEWGRIDQTYEQRIEHLAGLVAGGLNGSAFLNGATIADDLTVDVTRFLGREERDHRGVERRVHLRRDLFRIGGEQPRGHPRHAARRHRVHGDPILAQLDRPRERHPGDARLCSGVVRLTEVAAQSGRRRDVDDPSVALLFHDRRGVARAVERAF